MRKYLYAFKLYILDSLHYRFNTVVSLLFSVINIMVTVFFWVIIFESGRSQSLNSYSLKNMITYYIVWNIVSAFNLSNSGFYLNRMIKSGEPYKMSFPQMQEFSFDYLFVDRTMKIRYSDQNQYTYFCSSNQIKIFSI